SSRSSGSPASEGSIGRESSSSRSCSLVSSSIVWTTSWAPDRDPPRWLWLSSALTTSSCSLGITGARPGARERPVADEQLGQLGLVGRGRAAGHQILTLLRLGERDH